MKTKIYPSRKPGILLLTISAFCFVFQLFFHDGPKTGLPLRAAPPWFMGVGTFILGVACLTFHYTFSEIGLTEFLGPIRIKNIPWQLTVKLGLIKSCNGRLRCTHVVFQTEASRMDLEELNPTMNTKQLTRWLRKAKISYIMIPEQHNRLIQTIQDSYRLFDCFFDFGTNCKK